MKRRCNILTFYPSKLIVETLLASVVPSSLFHLIVIHSSVFIDPVPLLDITGHVTRDLELIVTVHLDEDYHKTSHANFIEIMLAENDGTVNCPSDKVHRLPFGKLRLSLRLYFFPGLFFILFF